MMLVVSGHLVRLRTAYVIYCPPDTRVRCVRCGFLFRTVDFSSCVTKYYRLIPSKWSRFSKRTKALYKVGRFVFLCLHMSILSVSVPSVCCCIESRVISYSSGLDACTLRQVRLILLQHFYSSSTCVNFVVGVAETGIFVSLYVCGKQNNKVYFCCRIIRTPNANNAFFFPRIRLQRS